MVVNLGGSDAFARVNERCVSVGIGFLEFGFAYKRSDLRFDLIGTVVFKALESLKSRP